jgi:hypothetical protein
MPMPVITEEALPERRAKRDKRSWLLAGPPVLLLVLLATVEIRPLELGPVVVVADARPVSGWPWGCRVREVPPAGLNRTMTYPLRSYDYTLDGGGQVYSASLCGWVGGIAWFYGHRERK